QAEDGIRDFHVTGVQTCALPIWAGRGAAGTQDAFIQPIELFTILVALQPFLCGFWRNSVQPRLDGGVLGVEVGQIRHKVLDYRRSEERRVGKECRSGWARSR